MKKNGSNFPVLAVIVPIAFLLYCGVMFLVGRTHYDEDRSREWHRQLVSELDDAEFSLRACSDEVYATQAVDGPVCLMACEKVAALHEKTLHAPVWANYSSGELPIVDFCRKRLKYKTDAIQ